MNWGQYFLYNYSKTISCSHLILILHTYFSAMFVFSQDLFSCVDFLDIVISIDFLVIISAFHLCQGHKHPPTIPVIGHPVEFTTSVNVCLNISSFKAQLCALAPVGSIASPTLQYYFPVCNESKRCVPVLAAFGSHLNWNPSRSHGYCGTGPVQDIFILFKAL